MAQVKKDDVQKAIVAAAKDVFLKKGFGGATLRAIARRARVTLSNLYTYYSDKDALFVAVLQPELDDLKSLFAHREIRLPDDGKLFQSLETRHDYIDRALVYIDRHRGELDLLLNRSAGSSMRTVPEFFARGYEQMWRRYFIFLEMKFPGRTFRKPSTFLLRNIAHLHLNAISEMLSRGLPLEKMMKIYEEITAFLWHGAMAIMGERQTKLHPSRHGALRQRAKDRLIPGQRRSNAETREERPDLVQARGPDRH
jgi:AcrR family transcriptional regulator